MQNRLGFFLRTCGITAVFWANAALIRFALAENIGAIRLAKEAGLVPIGGYGLNVTNSDAIEAYRGMGVEALFVSFELSAPKTRDLLSTIPLGMLAAGRLPLMQLRSCPARSDKGCGSCSGRPVVTDRKGASFPLVCRDRRYSTLLNSVPLYLADRLNEVSGVDYMLLYFTDETPSEVERIINAYRFGAAPAAGSYTRGLYYRGVI